MPISLSLFEKDWKPKSRSKEVELAFWNARAAEFNTHKNAADIEKRRTRMIALLDEKGMLGHDKSVLEICCGAGQTAIDLAGHVRTVTATDFSDRMLAFAKENAYLAHKDNIDFQHIDWQEVDIKALGWEKRFDLVMALKCPAISNKATLEKMTKASKGHCLISSFAQRNDSVRTALRQLLALGEHPAHLFDTAYYGFNLLWLSGYYPSITYTHSNWEQNYPLEEAIAMYTGLFSLERTLTQDQQACIIHYLHDNARNGIVHETSTAKIAWLSWSAAP